MAKNILICDDAAFMRMMIKDILTKNGYNVAGEAENGMKAVEKFKEVNPDLVLMDITMPEMDGIQALKEIKKLDGGAKVIMCSAMGQQAMVIESIQAGAKDFIVKPFQAERRLLRENREKIASLQRSAALLRKADLRIEGLEKMIAELNRQLAEKKTEVEQLRDELTRMGSEVETLAETVAERTAEVEDLSGEKLELENRLHTVYYIVGAEKELRDAQIVNKQGFIGRTLTVGQHGSMESFTQADSRLLSEIPVGHRKVTVVSTHPEGSYELVTDGSKSVEKLLITDPVRFWESSKVLVVSYK